MTYDGPPPTGQPYVSPEQYWAAYQPPVEPPPPPMGSRHSSPNRRPRWVVPTVLIVGALIVAGGATGAALALFGGSSSFSTTGTIELTSDAIARYSGTCAGTGGYSDMEVGVGVKVSDSTGKIVALGDVDEATSAAIGECTLHFTVDSIPAGKKIYSVEVSHRGALSYTEQQLRTGLSLTLGS